jgi:Ser/Thr protein kinase RdoA (MazF antagonist)
VPDYQRVASEFGLGQSLGVKPLADGHPGVVKLTTTLGQFVVKPAYGSAQAELYEHVALALNKAGVRQARPLRTTAGSLLSESGHTVQEFLPGRTCLRPTPAQTAAAMRHICAYHAALRQVPVPAALHAEATIWTRVASPGYLLETLPSLLHRSGLPSDSHDVVEMALAQAEASLQQICRLPRQLVHGDIGPDNVLMNGDQVVAIVDFTPFSKPVLFAIATAVYWYHVYGRRTLDLGAIRASLTAVGECRKWTSAEIAAWPAMLVLEGLRRLATPIAVAEETGAQVSAGVGTRYGALRLIMRSWPAFGVLTVSAGL